MQPLMPFIDDKAPKKVKKVKPIWMEDGYVLFWSAPKAKRWDDVAHKYAIYRFNKGERIDISTASNLVTITDKTFYKLPYRDGKTQYTYVVTALDRMSNESAIVKKKVKL